MRNPSRPQDTTISWYHGTGLEEARQIAEVGFKETLCFDPEDGCWTSSGGGGNLGIGIYLTRHIPVAMFFGNVLLRVELAPGTKIVDTSDPPDAKVLRYLQREFGRDIMKKHPRDVMPSNKRLTRHEAIELLKHHYHKVDRFIWTGDRAFEWGHKRYERNYQHVHRMYFLRNIISKYRLHGFGDPRGSAGVVVFQGPRVILREVVGEIPAFKPYEKWDRLRESFQSADEVRSYFRKHGSAEAKQLVEQVASRVR